MTYNEIITWEKIKSTPTDATPNIDLAIRNAQSRASMIRWEDYFPFPSTMPKAERIQKIAEIKADPASRETVTNRLIDSFVKAQTAYNSERGRRPGYTNRPTSTEYAMFGEMLEKRAVVARWVDEV